MDKLARFQPAGKRAKFFDSYQNKEIQARLTAILGKVPPDELDRLVSVASENFEAAVNLYLDKTGGVKQEQIESKSPDLPSKKSIEWDKRFVGSFQASLWCTRTSHKLEFGDKLDIRRLKRTRPAGRQAKPFYIVRAFREGSEVARVAEAEARFMSALIDTNVCSFSAEVIYSEEPLRTGDSIIVQVDVFLLKEAFSSNIVDYSLDLPAKDIVDESKESEAEKTMSMRQHAVVELFNRLNLTNERSASPQSQAANPQQVTKDQLDLLYRQAVKAELEEVDPAPTFSFKLHGYQRKALYWMKLRETQPPEDKEQSQLHPMWREFDWPDSDEKFYANLNSGEFGHDRPGISTSSMGGILADDMGLGKTIQALSLIHSGRPSHDGPTLIVAPMSLLSQWEAEAKKSAHTRYDLSVLVYYGSSCDDLIAFLNRPGTDIRIVITSYGIVSSEYKSFTRSNLEKPTTGLLSVDFYRVILDEAQTIKNRNTISAKACMELKAEKRWALTGTPIVNRLEDLYSLIKFLRVEPWNNFSFWRAFVTTPFDTPGGAERALATVQTIIDPLCLRRTKTMLYDGKPLVDLPEKVVEIKRLKFNAHEKDVYDFFFTHVRSVVQNNLVTGEAKHHYAQMMTQILRLRQICCHPNLLKQSAQSEMEDTEEAEPLSKELESLMTHFHKVKDPRSRLLSSYGNNVIENVCSQSESAECPICMEPIPLTSQALTPCFHMACFNCLVEHIEHQENVRRRPATCPICREPLKMDEILIIDKIKDKIVLREYVEGRQSSKVQALISELRTNPGNGKNVVFSQFTSFLDIIQRELDYYDMKVVRVDGTMNIKQRTAALQEFTDYPGDCVLLLSLKVGGVGLNLVCAQQAFLMDPWWSFAIESQAIDRIHRMGQELNIRVVRFIMEGSVEERMLQIQERKQALTVVVSEEEKKADKLQDIRLLFDLDDSYHVQA